MATKAIYRSERVEFDAFKTNGTEGKTWFEASVVVYDNASLQVNLSVRGATLTVYPKPGDLRRLAEMLNAAADEYETAFATERAV